MIGLGVLRVSGIGPRGALGALALLLLQACEDLPSAEGAAPAAGPATTAPVAGADVEAPEVFQVNEPGLWDGRPSLGGIWVAHPDVTEPERVRIVNTENGEEVIGALFRRERDLPGPALQVSSDAAEALGLLAGAPTTLRVTALRREEAPAPEPAPQPAPETSEPEEAAPEEAEIAAPEAAPLAEAAPEPAGESIAAAAGAALEGTRPAEAPAAQPGRVAEATAAILAGAALPPDPTTEIATTPLDAAPAAAPGPVAQAPAAASPLNFPLVQLATLSSETGAQEALRRLTAAGLPARLEPVGASWRLLLGPATTEAEQEALLARAVAEGFADAYLVRS